MNLNVPQYLDKKHQSIKFDRKVWQNHIAFLDPEIYENKANYTIFRENDRQHYLRVKTKRLKRKKKIKENFKELFKNEPIAVLKRSKNSKKLLGHTG